MLCYVKYVNFLLTCVKYYFGDIIKEYYDIILYYSFGWVND